MNINCMSCGHLFSEELNVVTCDGCERPSHREPCGEYQLIIRDGNPYAYFFCNRCLELEDDEWA